MAATALHSVIIVFSNETALLLLLLFLCGYICLTVQCLTNICLRLWLYLATWWF